MPAGAEQHGICDRDGQRAGCDRANARDGLQASACCVGTMPRVQFSVDLADRESGAGGLLLLAAPLGAGPPARAGCLNFSHESMFCLIIQHGVGLSIARALRAPRLRAGRHPADL
jgi:hypothetical protein